MQKLLVHNTVSIINIKIARWLNQVMQSENVSFTFRIVSSSRLKP